MIKNQEFYKTDKDQGNFSSADIVCKVQTFLHH
jgi:hypothetical protein